MYWLRKDWHTRMFLLRSRHHTSSWFSRRAISGSTPDCWMTSSSELRDWSCDSLLVMSSVCVYGGGPGGVGPGGVGSVSGWWCRCWLVMGCGWGGGMGWLSSNSTLLTGNRDSRHQISQLDKDMVYHSLTSQLQLHLPGLPTIVFAYCQATKDKRWQRPGNKAFTWEETLNPRFRAVFVVQLEYLHFTYFQLGLVLL